MKQIILALVFFTTCIMTNDTYSQYAALYQEAYKLHKDVHYTSPKNAKKMCAIVRGLQRWPMHPRAAFVLPADEKQEQLNSYHRKIEQIKREVRSKSLPHFPQERINQLRVDEIDDITPQRNSQ